MKYRVPGGGEDICALAVGCAPPPLPLLLPLPGEFVELRPVLGVEPVDDEDPPVDDEDELPTVAPFVLDDPPHAVSSIAADTSPAAAAHPLLRITYSIPKKVNPFDTPENVSEASAARRRLRAYLAIRPHSQASDIGYR